MIISVASGKGGTGKTTVAVNELEDLGRRIKRLNRVQTIHALFALEDHTSR